ncbi:MAG: hypothetical protein ACR2RE_29360 [Geminicoccaceae bacterium]
MATIALPTNAVPKRNVNGTIVAARDLTPVVAAAADTVEVCELPVGAVVVDFGVRASADLGLVTLGIKGDDITDDPDFFFASGASGANAVVKGNLRLGYEAETEGEVITFDTAAGIILATTGRAWVLYTMDADVA